MKRKIKPYLVFCLGVFIGAFGMALITKANIGLTPIACLPFVFYLATPLTFGMTLCIMNMIFVLAQVAILGKDFEKFQYLQFFVAFLLGFFVDINMYILKMFNPEIYFLKIAALILGCVIMGLGISIQIKQNLLLLPGDGLVKAICDKISQEFGYIKIAVDSAVVILAFFASLALLGTIEGIREGTIILALLTGLCIKFFLQKFNMPAKNNN
ncbi:DUF6198 family protein [Selenomonadales bacterium OttesenSCG-928-I06]|nr:DUF6198 family protein [Selenomonadales bacterium OttesenSCG-928-I06]